MELAGWAKDLAQDVLQDRLPRRWAHTQGVASTARQIAPVLGTDADLVEAACWLHDIGYAPRLHDTGFHPLDGARFLRDVAYAKPLLCRLVAHHSGALVEATERGLGTDLLREFKPAPRDLADALTYCDMTTGPDGQEMTVRKRIAEVRKRYGPDHIVSRAIMLSAPELIAAVGRVGARLALVAQARLTSPLEVAMAGVLS
jgi:putative nucleotidyltransferase with HDIG domain